MGVEPEDNPEVAEHLRATREGYALPLPARERLAEAAVGVPVLVLALLLAYLLPGDTSADALTVGALVVAYAVASRVRIEYSAGYTDVSLLVLVPMLFAVPAGWVPLLVMAGQLLSRMPEYVRGEVHPTRALLVLGNSAHALGSAAVLAAAGPGDAGLDVAPLLLGAMLAQFACDAASGVAREALAERMAPELSVRVFLDIYRLDAALAPVGLLIAIADEREPWAPVLAFPLVLLLFAYATERRRRLDHALELLQSELEVERARAEVFAALSHGLQTPLASVTGLAKTLRDHGELLGPERRAEVTGALHRDADRLRHLVRQALDYGALERGEELRAMPVNVDLASVAAGVAEAFPGVEVAGEGRAHADPARVQQVLTVLLANAVTHAPAGTAVRVVVRDGSVEVADQGPGVPPAARGTLFEAPASGEGRDESTGAGIGLVVARGVARAMGGDVEAVFPPGGGSRFTLRLTPVGAPVPAA